MFVWVYELEHNNDFEFSRIFRKQVISHKQEFYFLLEKIYKQEHMINREYYQILVTVD